MTIFQDLVKVYDNNKDIAGKFELDHFLKPYTLLPSGHISVGVQLEVTVSLKGEFITAGQITKDDRTTVIPATIKSANRASAPEAHPLQDKIKYVAGDYANYAPSDKKGNDFRKSYFDLLTEWAESPQAHPKIRAIYEYQKQNRLLKDLIDIGEITLADNGQLNDKDKNLYVRFNVDDENPKSLPIWQDQSVFQSWIDFYATKLRVEQPVDVDYLSGKEVPTTKLNEKNINPATSGAKLISANDSANFTYRGIFHDDDFYSVGYDSSQKMAHALKWLIQRQGLKSDTRVFVFWTDEPEENQKVADASSAMYSGSSLLQSIAGTAKKEVKPDTGKEAAGSYNSRLLGIVSSLDVKGTVHAMFLDAATTGRMATVYYNSMVGGTFKSNLETWGNNCGIWVNQQTIWTPSARGLIRSAYTNGHGGQRADVIQKRALSQLIISIINGKPISEDLLRALYRKLTHPQGYESLKQWQRDLFNYAAAYHYNSHLKGEGTMKLNQSETDRSYLFGRLLAIADRIEESAVYRKQQRNSSVSERLTTAYRFMTNFAEQPGSTWERIYLSVVRSYLGTLSGASQAYYKKQVVAILDLLDDGNTDEPLDMKFLTGFAQQQIYDQTQGSKKSDTNKELQEG